MVFVVADFVAIDLVVVVDEEFLARCRHGCCQAHFLLLGFYRHVFAAVCTVAAARIAYGRESGGDRRQTVRR